MGRSFAERTTARRPAGQHHPGAYAGPVASAQTHASYCSKIGASIESSIRIDWVVVLRGHPPETDRLPHERGDALGLDLLHDLRAITFDRAHTDIQLVGNGGTRNTLHHQIQEFYLSRRAAPQPRAQNRPP